MTATGCIIAFLCFAVAYLIREVYWLKVALGYCLHRLDEIEGDDLGGIEPGLHSVHIEPDSHMKN